MGGGEGGEEINRLTILIARQRDSLGRQACPRQRLEPNGRDPTGLGAKPEKRGDRASGQPLRLQALSLVAKPIHMTSSLSKPDRFPSTTTRCPSMPVTF